MTKFIRSHAFELVGLAIFMVGLALLIHGNHDAHLLVLPAMAYPTTLAFKAGATPIIGAQGITITDTTQRHALGTKLRFVDPTYGEIECIYLKGVAATAAGDLVVYDPKAGTTTRSVAASRGPLAVAMSANIAGQFGWYAVSGVVPVNTTVAGTGAANAGLAVTATAGQATVRGAAAQGIDGLICKSAQDAPGAGFTDVELSYPTANGLA